MQGQEGELHTSVMARIHHVGKAALSVFSDSWNVIRGLYLVVRCGDLQKRKGTVFLLVGISFKLTL